MKPTLYFAERNNGDTRKDKLIHPFDGRVLPLHPTLMRKHAADLAAKLACDGADYIVGLAEGGLIPAYALSEVTGIPFVGSYRVRLKLPYEIHFMELHSERASHFIYGVPAGSFIILIEDEITTGNTLCNLIKALHQQNIRVQDIGVYTLNCDETVLRQFREIGHQVKYLYTQADILPTPPLNGAARQPEHNGRVNQPCEP